MFSWITYVFEGQKIVEEKSNNATFDWRIFTKFYALLDIKRRLLFNDNDKK